MGTSGVKIEDVFSMKGGEGKVSYASNSQFQSQQARFIIHLLYAALDAMQLPPSNAPFTIADLGCSSGQNTLNTVNNIIKHLIDMYAKEGQDPPEFQAFFTDLASNDFNTLFKLLPPIPAEKCSTASEARCYYAAGVPGSFYRRLFPRRTINIFHSAFSLHWLSQVPESVLDEKSPAYNKGRIFIHGGSEHTASAYKQQFHKDFTSFIRSRSLELKRGGSIFLFFLGRTSTDPADQGGIGLPLDLLNDAWNDLIEEGLMDSGVRDNFNIPLYAPNVGEVEEAIQSVGSLAINRLEIVKSDTSLFIPNHSNAAEAAGRIIVNSCWAVFGVLIEAQLGPKLSDELFSRFEKRITKYVEEMTEARQLDQIVASISLV